MLSSQIKFLNEVADTGDGGLQPGNPANRPPVPLPGGPYPHPPGLPSFWYRPGSGGFNNDGEMPGTLPGPNDPRWEEWDRQWHKNNPKPTRQPNESDKDFRKRLDQYNKLLENHRVWKWQYLKWWQRTYGPNAIPR